MSIHSLTQSVALSWLQIARQRAIALFRGLISEQGLRIHCCQTPTGLIWTIHDPRTQRSYQFTSEQEVRCWIEQQYYRS